MNTSVIATADNDKAPQDLFSGGYSTAPVTVSAEPTGHNRLVRAGDLRVRADLYERRHYDSRDIEAQTVRAGEPHTRRPFPVMETPDGLRLVDGASLIEAICVLDPDTLVLTEVVTVEEALRIRSQNNASAARREPMAKARRARILYAEGYTNAQIAQELRIAFDDKAMTDARVCQLRGAAEAEAKFNSLSNVIASPARIPVSFYENLKATADHLEASDERDPKADGSQRLQKFMQKVADLVAAGCPKEHAEIEEFLGLRGRREVKPRARNIGVKTAIPNSEEWMWLAPDRKGGAISNYPPCLTEEERNEVLAAAVAKTAEVLARRPGKAD